jgi:hypothetical protein
MFADPSVPQLVGPFPVCRQSRREVVHQLSVSWASPAASPVGPLPATGHGEGPKWGSHRDSRDSRGSKVPNVPGQRCQGAPSQILAASTARQPIFAGAFAVTGSGQGSCVVRVCSPKDGPDQLMELCWSSSSGGLGCAGAGRHPSSGSWPSAVLHTLPCEMKPAGAQTSARP